MSYQAEYHAKMFLATNPTKEAVEAEIAKLKESQEWAFRNMGGGMDGGARSIHMDATKIGVYRQYLKTLEPK